LLERYDVANFSSKVSNMHASFHPVLKSSFSQLT
jgi:hypothetical protein